MSFGRNPSKKYWRQLLGAATKTGLNVSKTATRTVVHKAAEATEEFLGNKITDKTVKPELVPDVIAKYSKRVIM